MKNRAALFFFFLFFFSVLSGERDRITSAGSVKDGGSTLVSAGGTFELGFFKPGSSEKRYVGIWYKRVSIRTVVWVANREQAVTDPSGELKIGDEGNLVIVNGNGSLIWKSNGTTARNPVAQLLDDGNLVLGEDGVAEGGGRDFLWQSFDYPSDTLLPGMKLGRDFRTGLDRYLTSWRAADDPSPGEHTFRLEAREMPEIYLSRHSGSRSVVTYRSGPWNGVRFSGVPEMQPNYIFDFRFISDSREIYYEYDLVNRSLLSRLTVSHLGSLQRFTWLESPGMWNLFWYAPKDQCDNFAGCGPFGLCDVNGSPLCECLRGFEPKSPRAWFLRDGTDGCARRTALGCSRGDGFAKVKAVKLPETETTVVDQSMGLEGCEKLCLSNCSCTGYASADISGAGSGCALWYGPLVDLRKYADSGQDFYVRLAASELDDPSAKKRKAVIVIATVVPAFLLLGLSGCYIWKRKRNVSKKERGVVNERSQDLPMYDVAASASGLREKTEEHRNEDLDLLPLFDLSTVVVATGNFSDDNKLGEGGFGPVYKGKLWDGREIAVKRLSKRSGQGPDEFKNEVTLIAKLQHRNLVRLLGCCIEGEEKMLIYEYMHNRSLDSFIFDDTRRVLLDWEKRFEIIVGIARGLLYLHQDSRFRIIHRDLKASNILLDSKMNPRISDFGMARIFGADQTEANTRRVVGTYGYMSPEYAMDGLFSVKSDVFSFGVLVLEIVSGKKNRGFYQMERDLNLLALAWRLWKEGQAMELLDPSIRSSSMFNKEQRCIQVGLLCVQERAEDRPTMSTVVLMLGGESPTLPQPRQPGFCTGRSYPETDSSSSRHESCTVNEVTVTILQPR